MVWRHENMPPYHGRARCPQRAARRHKNMPLKRSTSYSMTGGGDWKRKHAPRGVYPRLEAMSAASQRYNALVSRHSVYQIPSRLRNRYFTFVAARWVLEVKRGGNALYRVARRSPPHSTRRFSRAERRAVAVNSASGVWNTTLPSPSTAVRKPASSIASPGWTRS